MFRFEKEPVLAHLFEGKRYDVGDKLGLLQATVEFALSRPDLAVELPTYLQKLLSGADFRFEVATGNGLHLT